MGLSRLPGIKQTHEGCLNAASSHAVTSGTLPVAQLICLRRAVCCAHLRPVDALLRQLLLLRLKLRLVLLCGLQWVHGSASRKGLGWACTCMRIGQS